MRSKVKLGKENKPLIGNISSRNKTSDSITVRYSVS